MRHNDGQNSPIVLVGPNFRVGMKIGHGNFGDIRLGETDVVVYLAYCEIILMFSNLPKCIDGKL